MVMVFYETLFEDILESWDAFLFTEMFHVNQTILRYETLPSIFWNCAKHNFVECRIMFCVWNKLTTAILFLISSVQQCISVLSNIGIHIRWWNALFRILQCCTKCNKLETHKMLTYWLSKSQKYRTMRQNKTYKQKEFEIKKNNHLFMYKKIK